MKQQTTVDWIQQQIRTKGITHDLSIGEILDQAKEMEKEQMIDFALLFANSNSVYIEYDCEDCPAELTIERPDTLFNEIYGGKNEN